MKEQIKASLTYLFNWRKHPASVFFLAVPLFVSGFGFLWLYAFLMYKTADDIAYLILVSIATISLPVLLYPAFKIHLNTKKMLEKYKRN